MGNTLTMAILQRLDRIEALLTPPARKPVYLDLQLIRLFMESQERKRISPRWQHYQRTYLDWWAQELADQDLRKVSLEEHILPALDDVSGARAHRIATLKRLYAWLRTERFLLNPAEDPTLGRLHVPQSIPAQWRRAKSFSRRQYRKLHRYIKPCWRDPVAVLGGTGWHFTELVRFSRSGTIEKHVLVCPQTKRGPPLRTRVTPPVLAAAKRMLRRGSCDYGKFRKALLETASVTGISPRPGHFRHAVATHAVQHGAPEFVADFLGHTSERTLKKFYAVHRTPRKVATLH